MNINIYQTELFQYIAGDSLVGKRVAVTIRRVERENVVGHGGKTEPKILVYFQESKKGLILNKTNAKTLGKAFGKMTDGWGGKKVILYSLEVEAFGELHNAVRIDIPEKGQANGNPPAPGPDWDSAPGQDDPDYAAESAKADVDAANADLLGT